MDSTKKQKIWEQNINLRQRQYKKSPCKYREGRYNREKEIKIKSLRRQFIVNSFYRRFLNYQAKYREEAIVIQWGWVHQVERPIGNVELRVRKDETDKNEYHKLRQKKFNGCQ